MIRAALRDLQWRLKRFVIAMAGVELVVAMGLIMTGLDESFSLEVDRTLDAVGAQVWAVSDQASGPFTSFLPMIDTAGGPDGAPMLVLRQTIADGDKVLDLVVLGVVPGRLGSPTDVDGAPLAQPGQVVVDDGLEGAGIGDTLNIGGRSVQVVGTVSGQRLLAGLPKSSRM